MNRDGLNTSIECQWMKMLVWTLQVNEKVYVFIQYRGKESDNFESAMSRLNAPYKIVFKH